MVKQNLPTLECRGVDGGKSQSHWDTMQAATEPFKDAMSM